ncbi:transcription elongation factor GreAB (plasmid) [Bacillus cereus]|uniref:HNH endonuclease n=1 Tax=Bacillus cereus TaxID=1396 RepID=UPI001F2E5A14|nr:group II intron reverse transcriptase/maturase [Bacillus cereus]UIJ69688.1 transcription elongation factor GreAB [Bacillus cereus]
MKTEDWGVKRIFSFAPVLYVPKERWIRNLLQKNVLEINNKTGKWKPKSRSFLRNLEDVAILSIYNTEIKGLYEYYKLARNVSVINKYKYIMEYSMYKTFAGKYNTSVRSIINKYNINGKFGVKYQTKKGTKIRYFYDKGFRRQKNTNNKIDYDTLPNIMKNLGRTSLVDRLLAEECEICGTIKTPLEIHHVRKLKDLKGKRRWEQIMIARRRKTIALCSRCHIDLHVGRLD